jgi:hypothetical protein
MQNRDVVSELEHHFHVVLDQQHAEIPGNEHALENLHRAIGLLQREALGRLVEHEQPRLLRDRHGHFEQALVAVREERRADIGKTRKPQMLERLIGGCRGARDHMPPANKPPTLTFACLRGDADILTRGERRKDVAELERARDALECHRMHRQPGNVLAGKDDFAGSGLEHARDQVEHGRLAGAVGADDRADPPRFQAHVDRIDGDQRAEASHQAFAFKQRHRMFRCRRPGARLRGWSDASGCPRCPAEQT